MPQSFFPAARMSERDDLNDMLNQSPETAFLGKSKPAPSPSPTPAPQAKQMNQFTFPAVTAFSLANVPKTLFRQPMFQSAVLQRLSPPPVEIGPFELGWPAPRFNMLRESARGGFLNPVFRPPPDNEFRF